MKKLIHSTALLYFTDEILKSMDDKKVSVVALLEMSKAFDSICHDLMLSIYVVLVCPMLLVTGSEATFHNETKLLI